MPHRRAGRCEHAHPRRAHASALRPCGRTGTAAELGARGSPAQRVGGRARRRDRATQLFYPRDYQGLEDRDLVLVEGDHDLLGDGSLTLLLTPGHTPGHQSVMVGERLILGADVAHFSATLDDKRFPSFADDFSVQVRSADRLRELRDAGVTVVPGHDPDVLRRARSRLDHVHPGDKRRRRAPSLRSMSATLGPRGVAPICRHCAVKTMCSLSISERTRAASTMRSSTRWRAAWTRSRQLRRRARW